MRETTTGAPTEIDSGISINLVTTNVNKPAKMDDIAAVSFEYLNPVTSPES